jgi:hypothetical protein
VEPSVGASADTGRFERRQRSGRRERVHEGIGHLCRLGALPSEPVKRLIILLAFAGLAFFAAKKLRSA